MRRLKERRDYRPPATPAVFAVRQYGDDRTPANGSSISFIFEYEGTKILLPGDAHAPTLATSLKRLAEQQSLTKLPLDAMKLPHHGSMNNVSEAWLELVDCEKWLISTNGAVFEHPDKETLELIARHCQKPTTMLCNYCNTLIEKTQASPRSQMGYRVSGRRRGGPAGGLKLSWPAND